MTIIIMHKKIMYFVSFKTFCKDFNHLFCLVIYGTVWPFLSDPKFVENYHDELKFEALI